MTAVPRGIGVVRRILPHGVLLGGAASRDVAVPLLGEFEGVRVAYLGTDRDLGVMLEIFSGMQNPEGADE